VSRRRRPRRPLSPSRRRFLAGAGALGAISTMEWLGFFRDHGVPGTAKDWGIAKARAQSMGGAGETRFLVYWFLEGGWMSYSMFGPVDTANHSDLVVPAGTLNPTPPWSEQYYRVTAHEDNGAFTQTTNGVRHGYLATPGADLFGDMAIVSSHYGNVFHSGSRFDYHYGKYSRSMTATREDDERTVLQAFCEDKGGGFLLPHVSWHRWLSDGELDVAQYPEGTGYYEKLGPPQAHTIYGRTPADLKARLSAIGDVAQAQRRSMIGGYADNLHSNLVTSRDGQSVRSFASALDIYKNLTSGTLNVDLNTLFADPTLLTDFGVQLGDEVPTYKSVNGNPARSKETPHVRVQAMMAYELMRAGISCGFWIESREVRGFDSHRSRDNVMSNGTQPDQLDDMNNNLWDPLRVFVAKLKATEVPGEPGVSLWDRTTIVLASEMGRTIQGDVTDILSADGTDNEKYNQILEQDICQHWDVNSVAFMGGNVNVGTQFGGVGSATLDAIPLLPDGSLDPAYDPATGLLRSGQTATGEVPNAGDVYATALDLAGVDPTGKGRNNRGPMPYVKKPGS
jgi:hypothetical protein